MASGLVAAYSIGSTPCSTLCEGASRVWIEVRSVLCPDVQSCVQEVGPGEARVSGVTHEVPVAFVGEAGEAAVAKSKSASLDCA